MKKTIMVAVSLISSLAFTGCEQINNQILKRSIEGVYANSEGVKLEFTESKVILDGSTSYSYKTEGKYIFIEDVRFGAYNLGELHFEIINPNTIRYSGGGGILGGMGDKTNEKDTFRKVKK